MKLLARCRSEGIHLTLNQVLRAKSLAHLAESVKFTATTYHGEERVDQPFQLGPIQRFYFETHKTEQNAHFNQSSTLRITSPIEQAAVKHALDAVVACHGMLRARYSKNAEGEWQQRIIPIDQLQTPIRLKFTKFPPLRPLSLLSQKLSRVSMFSKGQFSLPTCFLSKMSRYSSWRLTISLSISSVGV